MRGVCGPALKRRRHWGSLAGESHGRQPDSGNLTVRDETGGLRKREPVVELGTRRTTERVRSETLRLWAARAADLSRLRGCRATGIPTATLPDPLPRTPYGDKELPKKLTRRGKNCLREL